MACEYGARLQRDKSEGQAQLFGGFGEENEHSTAAAGTAITLPEATPWTETEQLGFEKETLGLYWSVASGRSLRDRAEGVRRAGGRRPILPRRSPRRGVERDVGPRRPQTDRGRIPVHRRHHCGVPAVEDAQRRPDGGLHPRGCRRQRRRSSCSRRRFQRAAVTDRDRHARSWCAWQKLVASAMTTRRVILASGDCAPLDSDARASAWRTRWLIFGSEAGRTAGRSRRSARYLSAAPGQIAGVSFEIETALRRRRGDCA